MEHSITIMNGKKALTLGCAVGVLACGACFLPPTPVRPALRQTRRIVVNASNTSATNRIHRSEFGACVANTIKTNISRNVSVVTGSEVKPGELLLDIVIQKEEVVDSEHRGIAKITLTMSISLTRSDGGMLWAQPARRYSTWIGTGKNDDPWKAPNLAANLTPICQDLANLVIYSNR